MSNIVEINSAPKFGGCKSSDCASLAPREEEILAMVRTMSNSEIAEALEISVHTVRAQLRTAFFKLRVSSRIEAYAVWCEMQQTRRAA